MSSAAGIFIETQEYRRFQEFCDACRRNGYIGLCYGTAGVGKTVSARYYTNPKKVVPVQASLPCEGRLEKGLPNKVVLYTPSVVNSPGQIGRDLGMCRRTFTATLLNTLQKTEERKLDAIEETGDNILTLTHSETANADGKYTAAHRRNREALSVARTDYHARRREIRESTMLIVVDETDRLRIPSLEQLRAIFDQGGIGLVLIGMPGLEKRLARYPQLYSRVGFVHEFRALAETELRGLLRQGWRPPGVALPSDGIPDEEVVAAILRITDGNFRLLNRLLTQIARVLTINNLLQVTPAVVEVARESLVIGTA